MEQAGVAHGLVVFFGDAGALAGDQRRGNLAAFAGRLARMRAVTSERRRSIGGPGAQIPWRLACALERLDLADGVARSRRAGRTRRCAPKSKPSGEIGSGGGRSVAFSETASPRLDMCVRRRQRHAHAMRRLCRRQVAERDHSERDPGLGLVAALVASRQSPSTVTPRMSLASTGARAISVWSLALAKPRGKGECRAADDEPERRCASPARIEPSRRHDQSRGRSAGAARLESAK